MKHTFLRAAIPTLWVAASLSAQAPGHLVGITRIAPALRHQDHPNCTINQCIVAGFPGAVGQPPYAGGTGWDPTNSGAWITNGTFLAEVDDGCGYLCPPMAFPGLAAGAVATGLEVVESQGQLWMIDSLGFLHRYALDCPPQQLAVCQTPLVPVALVQHYTTGLAVDECSGLVFVSYPEFATGTNWIVVSTLANPCVPVQRIQINPCGAAAGFRVVLGLAVDGCRGVLYATDGLTTVAMQYVPGPPPVAFVNQSCCTPAVLGVDPMIGLAVRPERPSSAGAVCNNGACPACPIVHTLRNDPNLGNAQFTLGVGSAPANSLVWVVLGAGPCAQPGANLPVLCGPLFATPILGTLGPVLSGGVGACDGQGQFALPLPVAPNLCNATVSSQAVALCVAGGAVGTAMSNCLSWTLQCN